MTLFQALIFYAANQDNRALTTISRSYARDCYNNLKAFEANVNAYGATDATRRIYLEGQKIFITACENLKIEADMAATRAAAEKEKIAQDIFEPAPIVVKPAIPVETTVIPPSVAEVQTGGSVFVSEEDCLSKTDVSGKEIEELSSIFQYGPKEAHERAVGIYEEPKNNDLLIIGAVIIVLFFVMG